MLSKQSGLTDGPQDPNYLVINNLVATVSQISQLPSEKAPPSLTVNWLIISLHLLSSGSLTGQQHIEPAILKLLEAELEAFLPPRPPMLFPPRREIKENFNNRYLPDHVIPLAKTNKECSSDLNNFYETNSFCRNPNPEIQKNRIDLMLDILGLSNDSRKRIASMISIAEEIHKGQTRKTGPPYITHPLGVAATMLRTFILMSADHSDQQALLVDDATKKVIEELVIFALFHDTVEDQPDRVIEWVRAQKQLYKWTPLPHTISYSKLLSLTENQIQRENHEDPNTCQQTLDTYYRQVYAAVLLRHILPIEEQATLELLALTKPQIDSDFFYRFIKPLGKYAELIKVFDRLNNLEEYIGFQTNKIPINVLTSIAYVFRGSDLSGEESSLSSTNDNSITKLTKLCKLFLSQRVEQLYLTALRHFHSEYLKDETELTEPQNAFKKDPEGPQKMLAYLKNKAVKLHSRNETLATPEALINDFIAEVYNAPQAM